VKVCLSGEGGDEMFMGYDRFKAARMNRCYNILPSFIRRKVLSPLILKLPDQPQKKGEPYIDASLRILAIDGNEATATHWKGFKDIHNEEIANAKMAEDIKSRPALFIKKTILNAVEYYFPALTNYFLAVKTKSVEQMALTVFHSGLWICAAFGIYYYRRAGLLLLAAIILYAVWYFPFATFIGHSLYTLGTIPFLSILAAAGFIRLLRPFPSFPS